jgi:thiosulfate/3-mercaptopyruvate sulfurtransferase
VNVPVDEWDKAAKAADIGFAKTAYWDQALRSLGVDPLATAVAYDDGRMTNAARVWFFLQYFGLKSVILNGGWPVLSSTTGLPTGAKPSASGFRGPRCRFGWFGRSGDPQASTWWRGAHIRQPDARGVHWRGYA